MKDVLTGAYVLSEIDKETVVQLMMLLVPDKLRYEHSLYIFDLREILK